MTTAKKIKTVKTEAPVAQAPDADTIATMAARIAELEAENDRFQAAKAVAQAPQAQDTQRKNPTEKLVQLTRSGNVRTTMDPSLELVAEVATQTGQDISEKEAAS